MEHFRNWIEKKDPKLCEGLGIMKIIKALMPGMGGMGMDGGHCGISISSQSTSAIVKGIGPNEKSARENALEKLGSEDADLKLIDKENDVYTFKVEM